VIDCPLVHKLGSAWVKGISFKAVISFLHTMKRLSCPLDGWGENEKPSAVVDSAFNGAQRKGYFLRG